MSEDLSRKRHHTERIRKKRKKYRVVTGQRPRFIETPKPCSCRMCGNPRKWNGDCTLQERRVTLKGEAGS